MTAGKDATTTVHASAITLGETGILLRGESGTGKSTMASRVVEEATRSGLFARLVADDRVRLSARHGRLLARPVPPLAGLIEVRGLGMALVRHEPCAVIRVVVDLGHDPSGRLPPPPVLQTVVLGVVIARATVQVTGPADWPMWLKLVRGNEFMTVP